ncbi:MAG TPA: glycosyltransferase [Thermoplasmata archaeon]|nr:glycosyltransferase [Thermoplasmata archaeon]
MVSLVYLLLLPIGFVPILYLLTNAFYSKRRGLLRARIEATPEEITILIPVHAQRPEVFARCLDTVGAQGCAFVVVGDGVDEPYRALTQSHGGQFLALSENQGKKVALRTGLAQVHTPYVLFVDSDVLLPAGAAVALARQMAPGIGGVGANLGAVETGRWVAPAAEFVERSREVVLRAMSTRGSVPYLDGACVLHRTELIRPYVDSAEFVEMRVAGRPSRLGDDWQLTDFLLHAGYRTVKAYDVRVLVFPKETARSFVRQNVRWARSNWIRLGAYFRRGFPRTAGRFYALEVTATYLVPIITLATLLLRLPLIAHALEGSSTDLRDVLVRLLPAVVGVPRNSWLSLVHFSSVILGAFATGSFVGAAMRTSARPTLRLVAFGAVAMAIMFATSIYGLVTFWVEPRWTGPATSDRPAPSRAVDELPTP